MGHRSWVGCLLMILSAGCGGQATRDAGAGGGPGGAEDAGGAGAVGEAGSAGEAGDLGGPVADIPGPGPVAQPAGLLYQGAAWTKPADAQFGAYTCRSRPGLPGCEGVSSPGVVDAAVDGQRLVVLVNEDPGWALLISDDLGKTVRRFALGDPFSTDGRGLTLHLFQGRVFVLADSSLGARVFEVDPVQGGIAQRGGDVAMSSVSGYAAADGSYTSVSGAGTVVAITRFHPETNRVSRVELPCADAACQGLGAFISSDGNLFNFLTSASDGGARCMVTVHPATRALETECFPDLAGDSGTPLRAFGSMSYEFEFVAPDHAVEPDAPWSLVPVVRNWLSAGPPIRFAPEHLYPLQSGFFAFSPSGFVTPGDDVLLRLQPSGLLEQSTLSQNQGACLTLSPFRNVAASCSVVLRVLPLEGAEVLIISRRDESQDDDHSRWVFEIGRSNAPFMAFQP